MKKPDVETIKVRGEFNLIIRDKTGKIVERYTDKNLIVNLAKTTMAALLGAGGVTKNINTIAFGTNATAPDISDTAIAGAVTKPVTSVTYPEFNSVLFNWVLGLTEGNGVAIAEFGLLSVDGTLFARKTRAVINKTADLSFAGSWKIIF